MLLNCDVGEDSWESLGPQGDPTSPSSRKPVLNIHWKDWCCSWSSNTLVSWCKELTQWKIPWCWERLKVGGEVDNRGWDGWITSPTQWRWASVNSRRYWRKGKPGVLQSMELQRFQHDWINLTSSRVVVRGNVQVSPLFFCSYSWYAYSESHPVYLGRSLDLLWTLWGQLRLRSCFGATCIPSQSL